MAKFLLNNALLLVVALALIGMVTPLSMTMSTNTNINTNDNNNVNVKTNAVSTPVDRRSFVRTTGSTGTAAVVALTTGLFQNPSPSIAAADTAEADAQVTPATAAAAPVVEVDADGFITNESGSKYKILKEGTGGIPLSGQTVKAHYTGWLEGFDSDKKFDSSRDRGKPFTFAVGKGQVIRGWDESFSSMKVGERRKIVLPPRLAYGDRGAGGIIPGGATLYFDVELLGIL